MFRVLLVLTIAFTGLGYSTAGADDPTVIDGEGTWTLSRLGISDVELAVDTPVTESAPIAYELPDGSSQGPSFWYLLHLRASTRMTLGDDGVVDLSAQFNGCSAALIEFTRAEDGGIAWRSDSALEGDVSGIGVDFEAIEVIFSNFLPGCGVLAGPNELHFQLEQSGDAKVLEAYVFADTSIEVSSVGPPDLEITPFMPTSRPGPDEPFEVGYSLTNAGREARGITISLLSVTDQKVETLDSNFYPSVTSPVEGALQTAGMHAGKHRLVLGASAELGDRPVVDITIEVGNEDDGIITMVTPRRLFALALVSAAAGLLAAMLLQMRTGRGRE